MTKSGNVRKRPRTIAQAMAANSNTVKDQVETMSILLLVLTVSKNCYPERRSTPPSSNLAVRLSPCWLEWSMNTQESVDLTSDTQR